jgi:hypothetical protein
MSAKDMHTKKVHTFIGLGAIALGVTLGIGVVYLDTSSQKTDMFTQAATSACPDGDYSCPVGQKSKSGKPCMLDSKCVATTPAGTCPGTCKGPGPGEIYCKSIGSCDGKKLEGKPKEEPKEEGKGGEMPKMPEIPKGGGGESKPQTPEDPCKIDASSTECQAKRGTSGVSNYLSSLFGTNTETSSTSNPVTSTIQSVTDKLKSFITGGESSTIVDVTPGANNPKEAVVTPAVVGGTKGQITAQGTAQASTSGGTQGSNLNPTVTGFGSGASVEATTDTGPILAALKSITARIQSLLSSLF